MNTDTEIHSTTQKFLDIYDIINDLVIFKDGATALIISVDAMNFGLLAEEEQDAIIYAYAGLLNSLNYPIQIVIKSQTKDVTGYLHILDEELAKNTSETKREWIKKYRSFVANLIKERNVLDKKFYIVIPATALEMGMMTPATVFPGIKQIDVSTLEKSTILNKAKEVLEPKRDHIAVQFGRIGLAARQLNTQEIIRLFYLSYNPEAMEGQQITNTSSYTTPLINASVVEREETMNNLPVTPGVTTPAPNIVSVPTNIPTPISSVTPMQSTAPVLDTAPATTIPTMVSPSPVIPTDLGVMPTTPISPSLTSEFAPTPVSTPASPSDADSAMPEPTIPPLASPSATALDSTSTPEPTTLAT